ncbi:MAG: histidine kinase [Bacteroidota bacterium]
MRYCIVIICFLWLGVCVSCPIYAKPKYNLDSLKVEADLSSGKKQLRAYLLIADHYLFDLEQLDSGHVYAQRSLALGQQVEHTYGIANAWFLLGVSHGNFGRYQESISAYEKGMEYLKKLELRSQLGMYFLNIGNAYMNLTKDDQALAYFFKALDLALEFENEKEQTTVYSSLAVFYARLDQFSEAIRYQKMSFSLAKKRKDVRGMIYSSNNLAAHYIDTDQLDSASFYAHLTLQIGEKENLRSGLLLGIHQLSRLYRILGEWDNSMYYSDRFIELADPALDGAKLSGIYRQKARVLDTLGFRSRSMQMIQQAKEIALASGSPFPLASVWHDYIHLHKKHGEYETALLYQRKYYQLKDSIYGNEKKQELERMKAEFQTEQQERKLSRLEQQSTLQQLEIRHTSLWILLASLFAFLFVGIGFVIHRSRMLSAKQSAMLAKQDALRAQMNPQFLFHALSAIQEIIFQEKNANKAARYLAKFAKLMRQILENSRESMIPLEQEIRTLRLFLDLQQVRFLHRFSYQIHSSLDLDSFDLYIQPLKAQPVLEDLFQSSMIGNEQKFSLEIKLDLLDSLIEMEIELRGESGKRTERIVYHCELKDSQQSIQHASSHY